MLKKLVDCEMEGKPNGVQNFVGWLLIGEPNGIWDFIDWLLNLEIDGSWNQRENCFPRLCCVVVLLMEFLFWNCEEPNIDG